MCATLGKLLLIRGTYCIDLKKSARFAQILFLFQDEYQELGVMVHVCNPRTLDVEVGRSGVQGQPGLHKTSPQRTDLPAFSSSWTSLGIGSP